MSRFGNLVPKASLPAFNQDLTAVSAELMIEALGAPTGTLTLSCQNELVSPTVARLMETRSFGKFRATGIAPSLDSLKNVLDAVQAADPELFEAVGSAGMLCVRRRRPASGAPSLLPSNHAWGTAVDITIDGQADITPDGMVQVGIAELIPFFNDEGWLWGGGFSAEDDTHFEVAEETIKAWVETDPRIRPQDVPQNPEPMLGAFDFSSISEPRRAMARRIVDAFAQAGFGRQQQAAALANAIAESGLRPEVHSRPPEDSVGLFQLNRHGGLGTGHSAEELEDPDRNIAIIVAVAQKTSRFLNAHSLEDAVGAFVRQIERPANSDEEVRNRLTIAQRLIRV